jgi:hypothetical protein
LVSGAFYAGSACAANGSNCFIANYVAAAQPLKAMSFDAIDLGKGAIRTSLTLAGLAGTLADCSANGTIGCVTTSTYKSGDLTNLSAGNIKKNVTIAGTTGDYPSVTNPLAGNTVAADLTSFGSSTPSGNYEFFDSTGNVYSATVADSGPITPSTSIQTVSNPSTLYRQVSVSGDANLVTGNIKSGTTIFGVGGSVTPSPANCSSNGSQSCVATGSYRAATDCSADGSNCYVPNYASSTQPLKAISYDAINSGKGSIRTSLTLSGIGGTLADCASDGDTGCVAVSGFKAADMSRVISGHIKNNVTIAGIAGTYPSVASPLATNTAVPDLTSFGSGTTVGSYEFFDSAGNVYSATVVDAGPVTPTNTVQTVSNTSALYRQVSVSGDANLVPANIKSGTTIFGVVGNVTAESHSNCSVDGGTGCVTTASFPAARLANFVAGDVKSGVTIAGVAGAGTLTTSCTSDGEQNCAVSGVFKAANVTGISTWDLRVGMTLAGVTGALKTNCRNTVNATYWDISYPQSATVDHNTDQLTITTHGFASNTAVRVSSSTTPAGITDSSTTYYVIVIDANTIQLSATSGPGAAVDITTNGANVTVARWQDGTYNWWDPMDDHLGWPTTRVTSWSSDTACDSTTWEDRTTTDGGSIFSTCAANPASCIQRDRISNLQVTKVISTSLSWSKAIQACNDSTYGGYAAGTWRLPTQKELMSLYEHGLVSVQGSNFITLAQMRNPYWSSSNYANYTPNAWYVYLSTGAAGYNAKTTSYYVVCVR